MTNDDHTLELAAEILRVRLQKSSAVIQNPEDLHQYLQLEYAMLEIEYFGCLFLDASYRVINHQKMFRGTVSHCATYPREIAREALLQNATFVIMVHNHPAQSCKASKGDVEVTQKIKATLATVDICLFDHIIVAGAKSHSMREAGELT